MFGEYTYIIGPIITMIFCQTLKFIIESLAKKKLIWERLFNGTGGIPSSHNALVFSLTTLIALNEGISSPFFAISLVFSLIIMYDSMSLRMATENNAKTINRIVLEIKKKNNTEVFKILKEEIGHEPFEVLLGILFGVGMGFLFSIGL